MRLWNTIDEISKALGARYVVRDGFKEMRWSFRKISKYGIDLYGCLSIANTESLMLIRSLVSSLELPSIKTIGVALYYMMIRFSEGFSDTLLDEFNVSEKEWGCLGFVLKGGDGGGFGGIQRQSNR